MKQKLLWLLVVIFSTSVAVAHVGPSLMGRDGKWLGVVMGIFSPHAESIKVRPLEDLSATARAILSPMQCIVDVRSLTTVRSALLPRVSVLGSFVDALVMCLLSTAPQAQGVRKEIPKLAARDKAEKAIRQAYASAYARTGSKGQIALASLLMAKASNETDQALRFVLMHEARRVAIRIPWVELAVRASTTVSSEFKVSSLTLMLETVRQLGRRVKERSAQGELSVAYRQAVKIAVRDDQFEQAASLLAQSVKFARRSKDKTALEDALHVRKQFHDIRRLGEIAVKAQARLKTQPSDPQDNLHVGSYMCFVRGEWSRGLDFLSQCSEVEIRRIAFMDQSNSKNLEHEVRLAMAWRSIASKQRGIARELKRRQIERRAAYWFGRAMKQLSGVEKDRIAKLQDELTALGYDPLLEPKRKRWFVLFRSSDPSLWNTATEKGENRFAIPLRMAPKGVRYLRLTLVGQDKYVVIPMKNRDLTEDTKRGRYGWNGKCSKSFGAFHLGIYDGSRLGKAGTIETAYGLQGWGFGHEWGLDSQENQAWAWDGRPIKSAVFEIAVTTRDLSNEARSHELGVK